MNSKNDFTVSARRDEEQKNIAEDRALMRKAAQIRDRETRNQTYSDIDTRRKELDDLKTRNAALEQQEYYDRLDKKGVPRPTRDLTMDRAAPRSHEEIRRQVRQEVREQFGAALDAEHKARSEQSHHDLSEKITSHVARQKELDTENSRTFRNAFSKARTDAPTRSFPQPPDNERSRDR